MLKVAVVKMMIEIFCDCILDGCHTSVITQGAHIQHCERTPSNHMLGRIGEKNRFTATTQHADMLLRTIAIWGDISEHIVESNLFNVVTEDAHTLHLNGTIWQGTSELMSGTSHLNATTLDAIMPHFKKSTSKSTSSIKITKNMPFHRGTIQDAHISHSPKINDIAHKKYPQYNFEWMKLHDISLTFLPSFYIYIKRFLTYGIIIEDIMHGQLMFMHSWLTACNLSLHSRFGVFFFFSSFLLHSFKFLIMLRRLRGPTLSSCPLKNSIIP